MPSSGARPGSSVCPGSSPSVDGPDRRARTGHDPDPRGPAGRPHLPGPAPSRAGRIHPRRPLAAPDPLPEDGLALLLAASRQAPALCGTDPSHARGPRADLRQVRSDPLDPARSAAAGHRRGTRSAAGSGTAFRRRAGPTNRRTGARTTGRRNLRRLRRAAAGLGVDRPGPYRQPEGRSRGGGQGGSAAHRQDHPARCRSAVHHRQAGGEVLARRPPTAPGRCRQGIRKDHLRRARPAARGGQRLTAAAQLHRQPVVVRPRGALGLLPSQRDGDGAHLWHPGRRDRAAGRSGHRT